MLEGINNLTMAFKRSGMIMCFRKIAMAAVFHMNQQGSGLNACGPFYEALVGPGLLLPTVWSSNRHSEAFQECRLSGPIPESLNESPHFCKFPQVMCTYTKV